MSKFATAIKVLLVGSTVVFSTLSSAYKPYPDQWSEPTDPRGSRHCEIAADFPGCVKTPRPRWDDCFRTGRYEPGFGPHFPPCQFPRPWDPIL